MYITDQMALILLCSYIVVIVFGVMQVFMVCFILSVEFFIIIN